MDYEKEVKELRSLYVTETIHTPMAQIDRKLDEVLAAWLRKHDAQVRAELLTALAKEVDDASTTQKEWKWHEISDWLERKAEIEGKG